LQVVSALLHPVVLVDMSTSQLTVSLIRGVSSKYGEGRRRGWKGGCL
jgi:hypothetical protein